MPPDHVKSNSWRYVKRGTFPAGDTADAIDERVKDKMTDSHQYRNAHVFSSRIAFHVKSKPVSQDMAKR